MNCITSFFWHFFILFLKYEKTILYLISDGIAVHCLCINNFWFWNCVCCNNAYLDQYSSSCYIYTTWFRACQEQTSKTSFISISTTFSSWFLCFSLPIFMFDLLFPGLKKAQTRFFVNLIWAFYISHVWFLRQENPFYRFFHPKMKKAVMNFLNHYCFKQLFSGGIEPPTSA